MPLVDGQAQLRGLVVGAGTDYRFVTHFNPFVRTNVAGQSGRRVWRDGSWSGVELAAEAVVPMRIVTLGWDAPGFVALHQALAAAFAPSNQDLDLTFAIGGVEYVMRGRPRLVEPEPRRIGGHCYYNAAFVALDPLIYSSTLHTTNLVLPLVSGGLTLPVTVPFTIGATSVSGRATISNSGKATTGLVVRVDGPVSQPRITLTTGGVSEILRFGFDLTTGQWIDVDTVARTVYINGTVSRRGLSYGDWPTLDPGSSEVGFDAGTYDAAATCAVSWRDAWR